MATSLVGQGPGSPPDELDAWLVELLDPLPLLEPVPLAVLDELVVVAPVVDALDEELVVFRTGFDGHVKHAVLGAIPPIPPALPVAEESLQAIIPSEPSGAVTATAPTRRKAS